MQSIKLQPGSFVDERLKGHETDLLYRIQTREGQSHLFLLFEHQSTPIHLMPVRLMRYIARIHACLQQENPRRQRIPMVLPLVLYQGKRPWRGPTRLSNLYEGSLRLKQALGPLAAELSFILIDLSAYPDEALRSLTIRGASMATLTLLTLKHHQSERMRTKLQEWGDLLAMVAREPNQQRALQLFTWYTLEATTTTEEDLLELVVPLTQPEVETMIKTTGQKLREEGRAEALRKSLARVLTVRFGQLLPEQEEWIKRAEAASLDALFELALKAEHIEEVLDR